MDKMNNFKSKVGPVVKTEKLDKTDNDCRRKIPTIKPVPVDNISCRVPMNPLVDDECIKLGQTFQSFTEVSQAITMYEMRNKVNLTQKYFRRIAANPKPSNKEDFKLTEEERKRFVYRWVDFCCTYFDDLLTRTDQDDEGGNGRTQILGGFAMKECPMRIRFQLRFNEKDLMISIFREAHDHKHPESDQVSQISTLPKNSTNNVAEPAAINLTDLRDQKRLRSMPPSLAQQPLSKLPKPTLPGIRSDSDSRLKAHPSPYPVELLKSRPNVPIPKPPPLKAMPSLSCNTESRMLNPASSNGCIQSLTTEDVVRNIYHYLSRMQATGFKGQSGLRFTSPNPDLIQITAELSGVDRRQISRVCQEARPYCKQNARINEKSELYSPAVVKPTYSSILDAAMSANPGMTHGQDMGSISNTNFSDNEVPPHNTHASIFEDADNETGFVDMPVEVIIKAEPEEAVTFYDENDSNSGMNDGYLADV